MRLRFSALGEPRLYVYGDGTVWRFDRKAMQAVVAGADWTRAGRLLRGPRLNYRTGHWTGLPVDLYQGAGSSHLGGARSGVHVVHYDENVRAACRMILGGGR